MKYNTKTITLTTDSIYNVDLLSRNTSKYNEEETKLKAEALAMLLWEYNKYKWAIPLAEFEPLKEAFEELVEITKNVHKNFNY